MTLKLAMHQHDRGIRVIEETLTDGSKVYDIELPDTFQCVTFADASAMANGLQELVRKHTNNNSQVSWSWRPTRKEATA